MTNYDTVTLTDITDEMTTITHGRSTVSVRVPFVVFQSAILPSFKADMMDRVYDAGRKLRSKEVALNEYFGMLNVAGRGQWVVVLN